jgi:aspartate carbamoyltransferase regulatory subunit
VRTGLDINHEMSLGMWSSQIQSFRIVVNLSSKKSSRIVIVTFENDVLSVKFISKVKLTRPIHLLNWWDRRMRKVNNMSRLNRSSRTRQLRKSIL